MNGQPTEGVKNIDIIIAAFLYSISSNCLLLSAKNIREKSQVPAIFYGRIDRTFIILEI